MKLYYSPGACSLAVRIALLEAGLDFDAVKVNLAKHTLATGEDYYAISPRGYVPLLELDDGSRHTEGAALLQYVGDRDPRHALIPAVGTPERLAVLEWLTHIGTEMHKVFSPWLWHSDTAESTKEACLRKLAARFTELDALFATREYLTGTFTVADAYAFTIVNWAPMLKISLSDYPHLLAYQARVAARPKVHEALVAEGLAKAQ